MRADLSHRSPGCDLFRVSRSQGNEKKGPPSPADGDWEDQHTNTSTHTHTHAHTHRHAHDTQQSHPSIQRHTLRCHQAWDWRVRCPGTQGATLEQAPAGQGWPQERQFCSLGFWLSSFQSCIHDTHTDAHIQCSYTAHPHTRKHTEQCVCMCIEHRPRSRGDKIKWRPQKAPALRDA